MLDPHSVKEITIEPYPGDMITSTIQNAIELAGDLGYHDKWEPQPGALVKFEFNRVMVSVRMDSDPKLIYRDWSRAMSGYIDKSVGPYPNPVLTDEEKENDARIKIEKQQRQEQRLAEYRAQADAERKLTEAKLARCPKIEVINQTTWQSWVDKNQDAYGRGIIAYAERWARLMQFEIEAGNQLEDIAEITSREADYDGITGAMYGAAVSTLAANWKYGKQLRKLHNKQWGAPKNFKGVVNPAILTVASK